LDREEKGDREHWIVAQKKEKKWKE
jgi:hypothetical protein